MYDLINNSLSGHKWHYNALAPSEDVAAWSTDWAAAAGAGRQQPGGLWDGLFPSHKFCYCGSRSRSSWQGQAWPPQTSNRKEHPPLVGLHPPIRHRPAPDRALQVTKQSVPAAARPLASLGAGSHGTGMQATQLTSLVASSSRPSLRHSAPWRRSLACASAAPTQEETFTYRAEVGRVQGFWRHPVTGCDGGSHQPLLQLVTRLPRWICL